MLVCSGVEGSRGGRICDYSERGKDHLGLVHCVKPMGRNSLESMNPFSFQVVSESLPWGAVHGCTNKVEDVYCYIVYTMVGLGGEVSPNGIIRFFESDVVEMFAEPFH